MASHVWGRARFGPEVGTSWRCRACQACRSPRASELRVTPLALSSRNKRVQWHLCTLPPRQEGFPLGGHGRTNDQLHAEAAAAGGLAGNWQLTLWGGTSWELGFSTPNFRCPWSAPRKFNRIATLVLDSWSHCVCLQLHVATAG